MKLIRVGCESCGGNLKVDPRDHFVICSYCDASLEVVHEESSVTSRIVQELATENQKLSLKVELLETRNRLKKLDEDWEVTKDSMMWESKHSKFEPNGVMAICQGLILWAVGGFLLNSFGNAADASIVITGLGVAGFWEWRRQQIDHFRKAEFEMAVERGKIVAKVYDLEQKLRVRDTWGSNSVFIS